MAPEPDGLIGVVDADGTYGRPPELLPNTALTEFPEVAAVGIEYAVTGVAVKESTPPLVVVPVKLDIGVTPTGLEGAMLVELLEDDNETALPLLVVLDPEDVAADVSTASTY